jgi:hypothetical protein
MKVKVMRIMGEEHMGAHYPPAPLEMESEIQGWLDDNPNASIEYVTVSPMVHGLLDSGSGNIWPDSVLVTIFYRD